MKDIEIKNAVIDSAEITMAERGILDCWLHLDFGGTGQGFGGYALYLPKSFSHHQVLSVAGHHIFRILEIAGVEKWSQLKGRTIRVEGSWSEIKRIGHIVKDDWYCPSADFKAAVEGWSEKPANLIHNGVGIADMYSRDEFENAMKRTN